MGRSSGIAYFPHQIVKVIILWGDFYISQEKNYFQEPGSSEEIPSNSKTINNHIRIYCRALELRWELSSSSPRRQEGHRRETLIDCLLIPCLSTFFSFFSFWFLRRSPTNTSSDPNIVTMGLAGPRKYATFNLLLSYMNFLTRE